MRRLSGVLAHISSLPSEYGIGSLGEGTLRFVDFIAQCGFSVWQVLPFCHTNKFNSPYQSYGSFSLNPYFIDLPSLYKESLITKKELDEAKQHSAGFCEFDRLKTERLSLLKKAALRYGNVPSLDPETEAFCEFMALKKGNGDQEWRHWTNSTLCEDELRLWRFTQFIFKKQWLEIKKYANSKGIRIIGDLPIYVAYNSADVWKCPENYLLDEDLTPTFVAGVPPDYFTPDGQLWGNPLYNWDLMKKNNYSWWCGRLSFMNGFFDGIRLDHFRAFESFYAVPGNEETAKNGMWMQGAGTEFIDTIKPVCEGKLMIAEDLGDITLAVEALVEYSGFLSTRVLQFGFNDIWSPHYPQNYTESCAAYTATHDNDTTLGFLGKNGLQTDKHELYERMLCSKAAVVIFPLQDILWLDSEARINTPGIPSGNWGWRALQTQLDAVDRQEFSALNQKYA